MDSSDSEFSIGWASYQDSEEALDLDEPSDDSLSSDEHQCTSRSRSGSISDEGWKREQPTRSRRIPDFNDIGPMPMSPLPETATPLDYFSKFITVTYIETLIKHCDDYGKKTLEERKYMGYKWSTPTVQEVQDFMAVLILTNDVLNPARMESMWKRSSDLWLIHTPGYWKLSLSFRRYSTLKKFFRLSASSTIDDHDDSLRLIRDHINYLLGVFKSEFQPGRELTVDECMIPFKGCLKPVKWGVKSDLLVDWETGYLYNILVYGGKFDLPNEHKHLGKQAYTVVKLLEGLEGQGHRVITDRSYTSPQLSELLVELGTGHCGTVVTSRKGFPKQLLKEKAPRGTWDYLTKGNLIAVRWHDKRVNYFLSNYHDAAETVMTRTSKQGCNEEVPLPIVVDDYNILMNVVEKNDQSTIVDKSRKQYSWPLRVFIKSLEWCLKNAHVLMKLDFESRNPYKEFPLDMYRFKLQVCHALVGTPPGASSEPDKPKGLQRLDPTFMHIPKTGPSRDKRCVVCEARHTKGSKREKKYPDQQYGLKRTKTSFFCEQCGVSLCIKQGSNCWEKYHTKEEYWCPLPWEDASPGPSGNQH